jgi:tellurite resistance protein
MLKLVSDVLDGIRQRGRQRDFVEATMAGCALVALADKEQRLAELLTRDRVLTRVDEMRTFDHQRALEFYDHYAQAIQADPAAGRSRVLDKIAPLRSDRQSAELLVRICIAIGRADQTFSAQERSVVEAVCRALDIHPGDLNVYDL